MMMITFITIKSSLVPLIEDLCAQIQELRFEIIGGLRSHLLLFFFGNMLKKKSSQSKISSRLLTYIYTCVLCTHTNICVKIQSIWILRALQVSHPDSWAHIQVHHLCSVFSSPVVFDRMTLILFTFTSSDPNHSLTLKRSDIQDLDQYRQNTRSKILNVVLDSELRAQKFQYVAYIECRIQNLRNSVYDLEDVH